MNKLQMCRIAYASPEYRDALALRDRILRRPIGLNLLEEDLNGEAGDIHLGAFDSGALVGVLVLTHIDAQRVRMRQVAVDEGWQGCGIGAKLVSAAERAARESGYTLMTLHARKTAAGFYEKLGYTAEGEGFFEVGIPHIVMRKAL